MIKQKMMLGCLMIGMQLVGSYNDTNSKKNNRLKRLPTIYEDSAIDERPTSNQNVVLTPLSLKELLIQEINNNNYGHAKNLLQGKILSFNDAKEVQDCLIEKTRYTKKLNSIQIDLACLIMRFSLIK